MEIEETRVFEISFVFIYVYKVCTLRSKRRLLSSIVFYITYNTFRSLDCKTVVTRREGGKKEKEGGGGEKRVHLRERQLETLGPRFSMQLNGCDKYSH